MEIQINKNYTFVENYKKIANTQRGITMLAIAMTDPLYKEIDAYIKYPSPDEAHDAIGYVIDVLHRCSHIRSYVRHQKSLEYASSNTRPNTIEEYKKDKQLYVIIDIFKDNSEDAYSDCEMQFFIWGETGSRKLRIGC